MQEPTIQSFFDPDTATVTHTSADRVIEHVRQAGLTVAWLLETHAHADHLSAAPYLKAQLGGQMGIGRHICDVQAVFKKLFNAQDMNTEGAEFDHLFEDGEQFQIGALAPETQLHLCHDYPPAGRAPAWVTTVQVNVRAGQLPPPEDNGVRYLKIPINVL